MLSDDNDSAASLPLSALLPSLLVLPRLAMMQLFALPGDPVPQAVMRLTGLTLDDTQRMALVREAEALEELRRREPAAFYFFVLVSWLAMDSPLGEAVRASMGNAGTEVQEQMLTVLEIVMEHVLPALAQEVPTPTAEVEEALHELFAREKYGLVPCLSAVVGPGPPEPAPYAEDEVWLTLYAEGAELNLLRMALHFSHVASYAVDHHPLARALPAVPGLGPAEELLALAGRLGSGSPGADDEPEAEGVPLNEADLIRLYLSLQVLALLFIAELQPQIMSRLNPLTEDAPTPWLDPEQQQQQVQWVCTQVEQLCRRFDESLGEAPSYREAQAAVRALAELL